VPALQVFSRSDTEAVWDDNDFSDVMIETGCPSLVTVTWPHEEDWEKADPAEANHETVHFTLDKYYSDDLTNKQLNLTIELVADERGPDATAGGYVASIVSVSKYDRIIVVGAGGAGTGGDTGGGGSAGSIDGGGARDANSGMGGLAGTGGGGGTGGDQGGTGGDDGTGGTTTITETGYSEAESPVTERATLRHVGDRMTITFPLPNKTEAVDSYDPTQPIKINVRIYNVFSSGVSGTGGAVGTGGAAGTGGVGGRTGGLGAGGRFGGIDGGGAIDASGPSGSGGASGPSGTGGDPGPTSSPPAPVYNYISSKFAISKFSVTDVGATP